MILLTGKTSDKLKEKVNKLANVVTNSDQFKKACSDVFRSIDVDENGSVDVQEIYTGVLLVYLKLANAGIRGLTPPSRSEIKLLIEHLDIDNDDTLSADEFTQVSAVLLGDIAGRVAIQAVLSMFIIPFLSWLLITIGCYFYPTHWIMSYIFPKWLAITVTASVLTVLLMPYVLDKVDEFMVRPKRD